MADAQGFLNPESGDKALQQEAPELVVESQEQESHSAVAEHASEQSAPVEQARVVERPKITPVAQQQVIQKDPELVEIEELLANNMTDLFLALPDDRKQGFKQGGEAAAQSIRQLMHQGKATARRVFDIIRHWLRGLPMINRFFLEQEAKIKTDEVMDFIERNGG